MTFRQFIHHLAERIGLHQIPVIIDATEIRHFLSPDAVHHELVTTLVRNIYKKNGCGHLDARIDSERTRATMGAMRASVLAEKDTDICRHRLINQLCDYTNEVLAEKNADSSGNTNQLGISRTLNY